MTFTSLGRVNQTTPGTPVRISSNTALRVSKILVSAVPGGTGKGYIGTTSMVKSTLSGVARVLAPNGSGIADQFFIETDSGTDEIYLSEYAFDMDVAGEGLLISYWTE